MSRTGQRVRVRTSQTETTKSEGEVSLGQLLPGDGWNDGNWQSSGNPGNQPGNPPGSPEDGGAGSGNFQVSAPVLSLPGRGIDLDLKLYYNSRLWNKSGSEVKYDIDRGAPAPGWSLGFGKIVFMGALGGCMLVDADGTRHGYGGDTMTWTGGMEFIGHTADGSFTDYGCHFNYGNSGYGWAKFANGTSVTYSTIGDTPDQVHPTKIIDPQGNYITITYRNPENPQLETITDTMGRIVTFQYDSLNRLISITVPRSTEEDPIYGGSTTRIAVKIHYKAWALSYDFASGITPVVRDGVPWVVDAIYYPGTQTGYWFDDADSYSTYGMI
ncbi:MAG: RHS repeat protein, partial [Solirubrobacterales bacterium]|nr:RHS repeat protein [Solirubrobacterales bacterium]